MLGFNWTFVSYKPNELLLQVNFENIAYVSANGERDSIQIVFYGFYLFADYKGNIMLPESELKKFGLPTLISSREAK